MFKTLADALGRDPDYPDRQARLMLLSRVLDGSLYDHLAFAFAQERTDSGEYVPILRRRPSVRQRLCGVVVDESVSLLFGDGRFPTVSSPDPQVREVCARLIRELRLCPVMMEAASLGAVGSVAILVRVIDGELLVEPRATTFLTPVFDAARPGVLQSVRERYKVVGADLAALGYEISDADAGAQFWFQRDFEKDAEVWRVPVRRDDPARHDPPLDEARTVRHGLGFVPMVWIRNLPGGDAIDGAPSFPREAIETGIEIDYQLSQAARGLRYASDPTLLIKEPASGEGGPLIRSASEALVLPPEGDAKLLEINGSAANAVIEYCRALREMALESAHGNRANADRISAAQSGRAMELMNQPLIWLADRLRASYGEAGLVPLLRLIGAMAARTRLRLPDGPLAPFNHAEPLSLVWPRWFHPTCADSLAEAQALSVLSGAGLISRETAVRTLAPTYDVEDPSRELARLEATPDSQTAQGNP